MRYNSTALQNAPTAEVTKNTEAFLIEYDENNPGNNRLWTFFINPSQLSFGRRSVWNAAGVHGARIQELQYDFSEGMTLAIDGLTFTSWGMRRSLLPLLEGLETLLEASRSNDEGNQHNFSPPILVFRWGERRFGPCILESVSWTEIQWLNGLPAGVQGMSLALKRVPAEGDRIVPDNDEFDFDLGADLTDRQVNDAEIAANEWLTAGNFSVLPPIDRPAAEAGLVNLNVSRNGSVGAIVNGQQSQIGTFRTRQPTDIDLFFVGGKFTPGR